VMCTVFNIQRWVLKDLKVVKYKWIRSFFRVWMEFVGWVEGETS
jgi:hypothetical protein